MYLSKINTLAHCHCFLYRIITGKCVTPLDVRMEVVPVLPSKTSADLLAFTFQFVEEHCNKEARAMADLGLQ